MNIEQLAHQLEAAIPQEILTWAVGAFGHDLAVVTSFQKTGIVTLHMLQGIAPETPVLTVDTGNLFPETLTFIDEVAAALRLNLVWVRPSPDIPTNIWQRDTDMCCQLRKIAPLDAALRGYQAWAAGVRRDQSATRAETPVVSRDRRGLVKVAPFATWTAEQIDAYTAAHNLPVHPLYAQGYPSIGCAPCTRPVMDGDDIRAGRWSGQAKTECGLHLN